MSPTVREFVHEGKAGQSPGKPGRVCKIGPVLLDAVAAKVVISQAHGVDTGSRSVLQSLKAATAGGPLEEATKPPPCGARTPRLTCL